MLTGTLLQIPGLQRWCGEDVSKFAAPGKPFGKRSQGKSEVRKEGSKRSVLLNSVIGIQKIEAEEGSKFPGSRVEKSYINDATKKKF